MGRFLHFNPTFPGSHAIPILNIYSCSATKFVNFNGAVTESMEKGRGGGLPQG